MSKFVPSPVYTRNKGGISYYSLDALDADADYKAKLANITKGLELGILNQEEFDTKRTLLDASAANDAEEADASISSLSAVTKRAELLSPLATDTRNARVAIALTLLNQPVSDLGAHLKAVKDAADESWSTLQTWALEPAQWVEGADGKRKLAKKSGAYRVPTDVQRYLDERVKEDKAQAEQRKAKADANKAAKALAAAAAKS